MMALWWRPHQEVQSAIEDFGAEAQEDMGENVSEQREHEVVSFQLIHIVHYFQEGSEVQTSFHQLFNLRPL